MIAVNDSGFQPSAPATGTHHHDLAEPLHHVHSAPPKKWNETSERKRKETPGTMSRSNETTIVTKSVKVEGSGSRGCVWSADFSELTHSIIEKPFRYIVLRLRVLSLSLNVRMTVIQ